MALEEFIAARGHEPWRAAWLLTGETHPAEDLVQTALMKTYTRYGARFRSIQNSLPRVSIPMVVLD